MSGWTDRTDYPDLGPGWVRMSKSRDLAQKGGRQIDHMYIAPNGQKFRSIKQAQAYVDEGGGANAAPNGGGSGGGGKGKAKTVGAAGGAGDGSLAGGRTKREPKPKAEPKPKSEAELAMIEAAREAKKAEEHARLQALNADSQNAICFECSSGDETIGNEILLCDGPGCHAAYHLRCLRRPLFAVPEGDWLCPSCEAERPAPPPAKMFSPTNPSKQLQPSLQAVEGCDLMRFAKTTCATAPTLCPSSRGPPGPLAQMERQFGVD